MGERDGGDVGAAVAAGLSRLSGPVSGVAGARRGELVRYLELLLAANRTMNLVSARMASVDVLVGEQLVDSLHGLSFLPGPEDGRRFRMLDVGSGGGFPAIPLLICRPDVDGVLVESTGKKAGFLERVIGDLGLTGRVWNVRFPDSPESPVNPPFDLLTTRAVAHAGRIVRAARPWMARDARAVLWTTGELFAAARSESGARAGAFHGVPGAERRGIGVLECFT